MTEKLKAYPQYKASGIEWFGDIPSHWVRMPLKAVLKNSSAGTWGDEPKEDGTDIVCFRVADFDYQHLSLSSKNITYRSVDEKQLQGREVKCGDIVIEKSGGGDIGPVGRAVISNYDIKATCSNFMHVISVNDKANNKYLNYLFATIYMHGLNRQYFAQTTGIQNLNVKEYLSQVVYFPSISEQGAIAAYLNDVIGKVDALIAEKQTQVEDLRAYRNSIITETVTRGLNPDAPLRHSGIDWLGSIPRHWEMSALKYLTSKIGSGITPRGGSEVYLDKGVLFIRSQNVYPDGLHLDDPKYISESIDESMSNTRVYPGDILLNITGASIGRCCVYTMTERANVNQHVCIIRPLCNLIKNQFLSYILNSKIGQDQIALFQTGGNREGLNFEQLKNFAIPLPPRSEQQAIAEFLDDKTEKIDALIDELNKQLDELAEYRQAVISEAVTGKVDVRDWTPKS